MQFVHFPSKNRRFSKRFLEGSHTYKPKNMCYNSPAIAKEHKEGETKMANRRLISKSILYGDKFSTLTSEAAKLYVYMILEADDDGFIGHMRQVLMIAEVNREALELLKSEGFVIEFKSGVCAVAHWRIHNSINRSGYTPTEFAAERSQVYLNDESVYTLR